MESRRKRAWRVVLVLALAAAVVGAAWAVGRAVDPALASWLRARGGEPELRWRLANLVLLPLLELVLCAGSILAAILLGGRRGVLGRLGLGPGRLGTGGIVLCSLGTLFPADFGGFLVRALGAPIEWLHGTDRLFSSHAGGAAVTSVLILVTSILPALGEELISRGLLLFELAPRLGPRLAIPLVALLFVAMPGNPWEAGPPCPWASG